MDSTLILVAIVSILWMIPYFLSHKRCDRYQKEYMVLRESWSDYKVLVSLLEDKYDCQEYIDQCIKEQHLTL